MTADRFQLEVVDRLARIETKLDSMGAAFIEHQHEDDERFQVMEIGFRKLTLDSEVARQVGRSEGRKTGAKWAAGVTTAILTLAEFARAWVR